MGDLVPFIPMTRRPAHRERVPAGGARIVFFTGVQIVRHPQVSENGAGNVASRNGSSGKVSRKVTTSANVRRRRK